MHHQILLKVKRKENKILVNKTFHCAAASREDVRITVLALNAFQSLTALLTAILCSFLKSICDDSVINSPEFPVSFFLISLDHKKSFT